MILPAGTMFAFPQPMGGFFVFVLDRIRTVLLALSLVVLMKCVFALVN